jgi:hypothetical protein
VGSCAAEAAVTASAGNPGVALAGGASACAAGPAVAGVVEATGVEDAVVTASAGNPGVAPAGGASACAAGPAVAVAEVGGVAGGLAGALAVEAPGWVLADASCCAVFGLTFAAAGSAAACDMALAVAASVVTGFGAASGGALSERA